MPAIQVGCVANQILADITANIRFDVASIDSIVEREGSTFLRRSIPLTITLLSHGVALQPISERLRLVESFYVLVNRFGLLFGYP